MENEKFKGYVLFEKIKKTRMVESYRAIAPSANPVHEQVDLLDPQISSNAKICNILSEHMQKIQKNSDLQGIMKIREFGSHADHFYVIKEYRKARSLREIINESNEQFFPINIDHSVYIIRQLCAFFQYIISEVDRGTVLYYIDPDDIIITFEGEIFQDNIYLADAVTQSFGKSMKIFGPSVSYFAPEYILKGQISEKNIIFSLGAVFYEILSNKRLMPDNYEDYKKTVESFKYPEEGDFEEEIDQQLLDILTKMIQLDPDERYDDLESLQGELDDYIEEGNFSPTTFHFVFFLETLFREYTEKLPNMLEQESEKAKLLELEAIRETEEEMLHQKVAETKKEGKFPLVPVIIVVSFVAMIILGLTLPRAWKDEAEAMLQEKKREMERTQTYDITEDQGDKNDTTEPVEEDAEDTPAVPPVVTEPPVSREEPEATPLVQDEREAQRRLEAERAERQRAEQERIEKERLALQQQEQQDREQQDREQQEREEKEKQNRISTLMETARSNLSGKNISEARKSLDGVFELDPGNKEANDLYIEIDRLEREMAKQQREELVGIPINLMEADTEPKLIKSPRIDLRQVESRIPRDVLRDLKNRVNRITVRMLVSENGDVESVEEIIVQKAVYSTFEKLGLIAEIDKQIRSAKYTPAIKDGMKRKCHVTLTFPWN